MQSDQINEFAAAFAKAQGMMGHAKFNRKMPAWGKGDGKREYGYADLAAIVDAIKKALSENGIARMQTTEITEGGLILVTRLTHTSGQWFGGEWPLPMLPNPQEMGKVLTYYRRYTLATLCGIFAEEDDDGASVVEDTNGAAQKPAEKINEFQAEVITQALMECRGVVPAYLAMFGAQSVSDIALAKYTMATTALDKKLSAMGKPSIAQITERLKKQAPPEEGPPDDDYPQN